MKKYKATGGGLLGILNRAKKPLICLTVSAAMLGAYSFACADDMQTRQLQIGEMTVEYIPFESEYTHDMDKLIEAECMKVGIDETTAIAIARLETGHYTSRLFTESNNFGGMGNGKRYYTYETPEDGAEAFVKMIKSYADKGMDTPKKMQKTYCPNNEAWADMVEELKGELR